MSKITEKCECDCSSLMHVCAIAGGANLKYGSNGLCTFNMVDAFVKSGDYDKLTANKYLTSGKYLQKGDILVKESGHTAMVLENGASIGASETTATSTAVGYTLTQFIKDVQAATGAKVDGIAGGETLNKTVTVSAKINRSHPVVKPIQKRLNQLGFHCGAVDGIVGAKTTEAIKLYQQSKKCIVDGELTARHRTWQHILEII
jgi:peptidoglycan hydrolase-like protein with peptidoglycan-binding domain